MLTSVFLLQAAVGYGLLVVLTFVASIFIGIPYLAKYFYKDLKRDKLTVHRAISNSYLNSIQTFMMMVESLIISILVVSISLFLAWKFILSQIDLTYS